MTCIIVDDEATSRVIIRHLCTQTSDLDLIDEFPNAIEAVKFLNREEIDLIFLDIHMPDFSGFDFLQTLKTPPKVVLTTSDKGQALDAFEYECVIDYLVKPIQYDRFQKAVQKAKAFAPVLPEYDDQESSNSKASDTEFYVNIDRTLIKIQTNTVDVIEAKGDYILIKTTNKDYKVHATLKNIIEKLPDQLFLHVHRSYIINLSKIIDIQDNTILIEKYVIPISRSKRPELMRRLNLL